MSNLGLLCPVLYEIQELLFITGLCISYGLLHDIIICCEFSMVIIIIIVILISDKFS